MSSSAAPSSSPLAGCADERAGERRRDERARDHRLRKAHDVEPEHAAEQRDRNELDELDHGSLPASRSSSERAARPARPAPSRSTPRAASSRSCALFVGREEHVAQPLHAPGARVNAADVHRVDAGAVDEAPHRRDVAGEQDAGAAGRRDTSGMRVDRVVAVWK